MRKYFSEFGLNVYTSYKTLIPVEHLDKVKDDARYHIYMILSVPRVVIEKESVEIYEDEIQFTLKKIVGEEEELHRIRNFKILSEFDHRKVDVKIKYPYNTITCKIDDSVIEDYYDKNKSRLNYSEEEFKEALSRTIDAQVFLNDSYIQNSIPLEMEVLYIGQSYGEHGERLAQMRLSSHEKLQKILTDCHTKYQDKRIFILLLEMTPILNTTFDGINKEYAVSEKEEEEHFKNGIMNLPVYNQVINITEAALINYFKPTYNTNFVENFPCNKHKGYSQYYNLDYNCMSVELDLEFEHSPNIQLYSNFNRINCCWDYVKYDLFNDQNRKNMYDIFKKNDNKNN